MNRSNPELNEKTVNGRVSQASLIGPAAGTTSRAALQVPTVRVARSEQDVERDPPGGAKLKMPAAQAARLTKAYNRLISMRNTGSAEAVVLQQIDLVREELESLKKQCEAVQAVDEKQQEFKNVWMQKHMQGKERFLAQLRQSQEEDEYEEEQSQRGSLYSRHTKESFSSSVQRALKQAEEDHARLEEKLRQLTEQQEWQQRQEERRRQEEEEQRVQNRQQQLDLRRELEGVKARQAALSQAASNADERSCRGSIENQSVQELPPEHEPRRQVENWLQNAEATRAFEQPQGGFVRVTAPSVGRGLSVQDQLLQHVVLSQAKLPIFKGEPLEFLWFRNAFEAQVSSVTTDPARRLYLLLQQLQGQPYNLVKGCQLLEPEVGYNRAMSKLQERYGHPVRQAMAFRSRLLAWPTVKGTQDLEDFSIQLQLCQDVKLSGSGLAELDSPATLLQLASKLSGKLQLSWQTKAFDIEQKELREAVFVDFVRFVERQAGLRCHPVYGKLSHDPKPESKGLEKKGNRIAATRAEEEEKATSASTVTQSRGTKDETADANTRTIDAFKAPCLICGRNHATNRCQSDSVSKKERYERLQGLCFACLKPGHLARFCTERATCGKCGLKHPTILHFERNRTVTPATGDKSGNKKEAATKSGQSESTTSGLEPMAKTMATGGSDNNIAVATVPIKVWNSKNSQMVVHAVLDPASTATFITQQVVDRLGLKTQTVSLGVTTMTNQTAMAVGMVQGLNLSDLDGNNEFAVPVVYAVKSLPFDRRPRQDEVERWPHLKEVPFQWEEDAPVAMLVGLNVAGALRPEEIVRGGQQEPYAVKTPLGWAVHGALHPQKQHQDARVFWTKAQSGVREALERLHYADFKDAYDFTKRGESQDDRDWRSVVETTIKRTTDGKQYEVDLPFRVGARSTLKNNYTQALQRLHYLKMKFDKCDKFKADYYEFMNKMIQAGYVEEVSEDMTDGTISYVLHHGVYHPKKPGKIRIVFNCACRYKGTSLNDCLLQGPDLTNSLVGVLLRFRQYATAFMADIESMFYRVQVPSHDRNVLRFLWWKEGGEEVAQYRLKVHLFGATSSPSVANFALRRAAEEAQAAKQVSADTERTVRKNFYVDDCLKSMGDEEEAIRTAHELIKACEYGGFRLTKFVSTSHRLLQSLPASELAKEIRSVDLRDHGSDPLGALQHERALGVAWDVARDCFHFRVKEADSDEAVTKRTILSRLSKVYDPLGLAAPVIIVARVLFRELTRDSKSWDEEVNSRAKRDWLRWEEHLVGLASVQIPRCLLVKEVGMSQLHVFCDASMEAYAAVAYLRLETTEGVKLRFIMGKARVTPPKVVTIPRLELTAAKLAVELAELVRQELEIPISRRVLWSDSMSVLKYLRNRDRRFHVFVANRVCAILTVSKVEEWRYIPTNSNPADEATRGIDAHALGQSNWIHGPTFLLSSEQDWPDNPETQLSEKDEELQRKVKALGTAEQVSFVERLATRCSTAAKVRRLVAACLRVKERMRGRATADAMTEPFRLTELREAERAAILYQQREEWAEEMVKLGAGGLVPKSSVLFKLSPRCEENGLIVMKSRTRMKLPIVPKGALGQLLVQEAHERQCHQGRNITAAEVQRRYWVIGLNKTVRGVVRRCPGCQRRRARPRTTIMAPLPMYRWKNGTTRRPFEVTGVDYFGPFKVKRGRGKVKGYGVIFTCAVTRAVHLEVAEDLSSESFINALRRFVARRGLVRKFISDNGTNFVGAKTLLNEGLKEELKKLQQRGMRQVEKELQKKQIEWEFNAPGASHHGGFWERLIQSVRRILDVLLEQNELTYEALVTMLCECEAVLNNRPITPLSEDPEDFEALTPNHLLLGGPSDDTPSGNFDCTAAALRNQWKRVQHLANEFWRRWHREYKVLLAQRAKWHRVGRRRLQVNDPVLIVDPLQPRQQWKLGRVVQVYCNPQDGDCRVADVQTKSGILKRPITRLCLLETASENSSEDSVAQ